MRAARLIAAASLVLTAASPDYLRFLVRPLGQTRAAFATISDEHAPGITAFLLGVREHTQPGDSVALVVPSRDWDHGYSYAYFRAVYLLSGRRVIPVVNDRSEMQPERLREAGYVAAWGARFRSDEFVSVWSGSGGALSMRR